MPETILASSLSPSSSSLLVNNNIVLKNSNSNNHSLLVQLLLTTYSITKPNILRTFPMKKNHEIAKIPSNIYSLKQNELIDKYRVEIGVRTAIVLGSMVFFIVFYFLWHNIAKFFSRRFRKSNRKSKHDYNLDYWLDYIDQRARRKANNKSIVIIYSPKLPDLPYDSRVTTKEWVTKHKEIWNNMQLTTSNKLTNWYQNPLLNVENSNKDTNEMQNPFLTNKKRLQSTQNNNLNYSPTLKRIKSVFISPFRTIITKRKTNYKTVRRSVVYRELEANAQLIDSYYKDILESVPSVLDGFKLARRRHSWPKCNKDYLKLQSFDLIKDQS